MTTMVASMLIASATSFGSRACSRACKGQTIAMMNSAKVSGAKTGCGDAQGGDHEDCGSNTDHRAESAVARSACSLDWIAHCAGAFGGCHSV